MNDGDAAAFSRWPTGFSDLLWGVSLGYSGARCHRTPSPSYASHEELRQVAVDVLPNRDTGARRNHPAFQELLHPPAFAFFQDEPQVNCKLALWLADWEVCFWEWHRDAARALPGPYFAGFCRRALRYRNRASCHLVPVRPVGCPQYLVVPPAPPWFQDAMCLDVLGHADPDCSELCSLRRLVYSVELASLAPTLRFCPPSPGGPTLQQPRSVTSLVSDWQYLRTWFWTRCPFCTCAPPSRSRVLPFAVCAIPALLACGIGFLAGAWSAVQCPLPSAPPTRNSRCHMIAFPTTSPSSNRAPAPRKTPARRIWQLVVHASTW